MTRRIHTPALLALLTALVLSLVGCGGTTTGADAEAARACVQTAMEDVRTQAPDARQAVLDELESHVEKPLTQLVEKCAGKWEAAAPTLWELLDGSEPQQVQISVSCTKEADGTWSCDDGLKRALTDLCLK